MRLLRSCADSVVLFASMLFAYLLTMAPGWGAVFEFNNWDGLEFLLCARLGGVDHPPGHPLYLLLARAVMAILFFVPPALALNLVSVGCAALAVALIHRVTLETLSVEGEPDLLGRGAAAVAAAVLGFSIPFWGHAVIPTAYPLYLALSALELLAAVRWLRSGGRGWLLAVGGVGGLLLATNFLNALVLLAPLVVLLALWGRRDRPGWLWALLLMAVLGMTPYLYYWVVLARGAAFVHPMARVSPYPLGSAAWFGWYVRGSVWTGQHMFALGRIPANLPRYLASFVQTLGWPGLLLLLGLAGTGLRARRDGLSFRWPALLLILFVVAALPQISVDDPSNPGSVTYLARFYLPSFVLATPLVGTALAWALRRIAARGPQPWGRARLLLLVYAALMWPLYTMARSEDLTTLRFEDTAGAWARAIYAEVPDRSVIVSPLVHAQLALYFETVEPLLAGRSVTVVAPSELGGSRLSFVEEKMAEGRPVFLGGDAVDPDKAPEYRLISSLVLEPLTVEKPRAARRAFSSELALYRVEAVREARPMTEAPAFHGMLNDGTFSGALRLLGVKAVSVEALPDRRRLFTLDLSWEVLGALPGDLTGVFGLRDEAMRPIHVLTGERMFALGGRRPTSRWKVGEKLTDRVCLFLPALPPGRFVLSLGLVDAHGRPLEYWPASHRQGQPGFDAMLLMPLQFEAPPAEEKR